MESPIDADTPITLTVTITDDKDTVLCSEKVHAFPGDTLTLSRVLTDIPAGTICTATTQLATYDAVLWSIKKTQDFAIGEASMESMLIYDSRTSSYYDLQGRPVANPTRGIYIKDGKKVAIK